MRALDVLPFSVSRHYIALFRGGTEREQEKDDDSQ